MGAENLRSGDEEEPRETKKEQQQGWGWGASKAQGPRSQGKKGFQGGGNTKLDQGLRTLQFGSLRVLVTLTRTVGKTFQKLKISVERVRSLEINWFVSFSVWKAGE